MQTIACVNGMGVMHSPFFQSYASGETTCGIYNRRFFPWHCGESATEHYWALRRQAVLYDVPETPIEIIGPDAEQFLNGLLTRDVSKLKVGRAAYGLACLPDGGMLMDGVVMRLSEDRFWYVQANGAFLPWLLAHSAGLDVSVRDPQSWVLQVQGPSSMQVLEAACDEGAPENFRYFDVRDCTMAGQSLLLSRSGWTGELGFEVYTTAAEPDGASLWRHLLEAGAPHGLIWSGLRSMQIRRVEAGILDYGVDMDRGTTPFQAGMGKFVSFSKPDFIGKQALQATDKRAALFGVKCADGVPVYRSDVEAGGKGVGLVSSPVWSPFLECGIAYVMFREPNDWVGSEVKVTTTRGEHSTANVVELPFYDPEKRIARGLDQQIP